MTNIYCTYDKVSEEFSQPWFAKNDNVAKRNLLIASRRENLPLEDINLFCIGIYDSDEGKLRDITNKDIFINREVLLFDSQDKEESK